MRSGNRRGWTFALGLSCVLAFAATAPGRADVFPTIPRLVPAVDVNTGGPYYAPPIPYGHYTGKNCLGKMCSMIRGCLPGHGCGNCGGKGCGACGKGQGQDNGCGLCGGKGCGACGFSGGHGHHGGGLCANGNGLCGGGHAAGQRCNNGGLCGNGNGGGGGCGLLHHHGAGCGAIGPVASEQAVPMAPVAVAVPSAQGVPCHACGGKGCGLCGLLGKLCGGCGGKGCGLCHGTGRCFDPGKGCGRKGCGLCQGKQACQNCGGKGCGLCSKAHGLVNHLLGRDQIKWFVGPGGPVPLTPGYTPYVVTTRSPRDFLAFPPFVP